MRALCLLAPATIIGQAKLNRHDHRPEIKDAQDLQVACFSEIAWTVAESSVGQLLSVAFQIVNEVPISFRDFIVSGTSRVGV